MNRLPMMFALISLGLTWSLPANAQEEAEAKDAIWNHNSARTLPRGRVEFGLFSPSRVGITDRLELQTNLLLDALLPNLGVKGNWAELGGWSLGSAHTLRYTTRLYSVITAEGTGGILPANIAPPQMIELDNAILLTRDIKRSHALSLDLGASVIPKFSEGVNPSGSLPVVDFPFLYTRTAAANGGATLRAGVAMTGSLVSKLEYLADVDVYYNTAIFLAPALEQGASLAWRFSDHVSLSGGYRLALAKYEYGTRLHVMPTLDLRVGFQAFGVCACSSTRSASR